MTILGQSLKKTNRRQMKHNYALKPTAGDLLSQRRTASAGSGLARR